MRPMNGNYTKVTRPCFPLYFICPIWIEDIRRCFDDWVVKNLRHILASWRKPKVYFISKKILVWKLECLFFKYFYFRKIKRRTEMSKHIGRKVFSGLRNIWPFLWICIIWCYFKNQNLDVSESDLWLNELCIEFLKVVFSKAFLMYLHMAIFRLLEIIGPLVSEFWTIFLQIWASLKDNFLGLSHLK